MAKDGQIREKMISIQSILLPHFEVMQKELKTTKDLVQRDTHLSLANNLIALAPKLEIKIHILESIRSNWDNALAMILQLHKPFLDKNNLTLAP